MEGAVGARGGCCLLLRLTGNTRRIDELLLVIVGESPPIEGQLAAVHDFGALGIDDIDVVVVTTHKGERAVRENGPIIHRLHGIDGHLDAHFAIRALLHVHARAIRQLHSAHRINHASVEIGAQDRRGIRRRNGRRTLTRIHVAVLLNHHRAAIEQTSLVVDVRLTAAEESQIARLWRRHHAGHFAKRIDDQQR